MLKQPIGRVAALALACLGLAAGARAQTTVAWTSASGGNWTNASNWAGSVDPNSGAYIASITVGGTYTVTLDANETIYGLTLGNANATLQLNSNTLTFAGGIATLSSGTISNGTLAGPFTFASGSVILNGVTVTGPYTMGTNSSFDVKGTTTLQGTGTLVNGNDIYGDAAGATLANQGAMTVVDSATINGNGYSGFTLNNSGSITSQGGNGFYTNLYLVNGTGDTLQNSGLIESYSQAAGYYSQVLIGWTGSGSTINNTGTLEANGPQAVLFLGYNNTSLSFSNTGGTILAVNGGSIDFEGAFTSAELAQGTLNGAGGSLNIIGSVNNSSATLPTPASGVFTLDAGTITGGVVTANALAFSASGGVLAGVTANGPFTLPAGTTFNVAGTTTLTGTWTLDSGNNLYAAGAGATLANQGTMNVNGGTFSGNGNTGFTLNNSGSITNTGGNGFYVNLYLASTGDTLANSGLIESYSPAAGYYSQVLAGWTGGGSTINNSGTMEANGPQANLYLGYSSGPITFSNTGGTILATNGGSVFFYGAFTAAELGQGTINGSGGTLNIDGQVTDTGTALPTPAGGVFTLDGGLIIGGTVTNAALQFSSSGGTLQNVTANGTYVVGASDSLSLMGTSDFTGNVTLGGSNTIHLAGNGTATSVASGMTWQADGGVNIYAQGSGDSFSNPGTMNLLGGTISGQGNPTFTLNNSGSIVNTGGSGSYNNLYLADGSGDALNNSGLVESYSPAAGYYSQVLVGWSGTAANISNTGTMEANGPGSALLIGYNSDPLTFSNTGGTIAALNGGTVDFYGAFTSVELAQGTINGAGGTLNIDGQVTNTGTALPIPSSGIFTLDGGTIIGGTVTNTALQFSSAGGLLQGATLLGTFNVGTGDAFTMSQTSAFTGNVNFAGSDTLYLSSSGTTTGVSSGQAWVASGNLNIFAQSSGITFNNPGTMSFVGGYLVSSGGSGLTINNTGSITNNGGNGSYTNFYVASGSSDILNNSGLIESYSSGSNNYSQVLVGWSGTSATINNTGTIEANGPQAALFLGYNSNTFLSYSNTGGTIAALGGGTVDFYGSFTSAQLAEGTINGSGGTLNIDGYVDNTSATLPLPASGIFVLDGGTIKNGFVPSTALQFSSSGGLLLNVTATGAFTVGSGDQFDVQGTTNFTGNVTFVGSDTVYQAGSGTTTTVAPSTTWQGNGSINIYAYASGVTFANQGTINLAGGNISGAGYSGYILNNSAAITNNGGNGSYNNLYLASGGGGDTLVNSGVVQSYSSGTNNFSQVLVGWTGNGISIANTGTLEANGPQAILSIGYNSTPFTSYSNVGGIISAINGGTVDFYGIFTSAQLAEGTINGSGGTLNINGTVNNGSATLPAPTSGIYTLDGGTIMGGTVAGSSNALTFSSSGGLLNGVAMTGNFSVPSSGVFTLEGGTSFAGGTVTLAGANTVYFGDATGLSLPSGETWTDSGTLNFYAQLGGATLANQGSVTVSGANVSGNGHTFLFNNSGTFVNSGSGFANLGINSGDTVTNSGTIEQAGPGGINVGTTGGSVTNLASNTLTGGTWEVTGGGTMSFYGPTPIDTIAPSTTVILGSTGSTIRTDSGAGPSYQTLEQTLTANTGTLEVLAGRNFVSTSAGITNGGTIQLGGGTLSASSLTNTSGSFLSGNGTFAPTGGVALGNGATVSPGYSGAGNSIATLSFNTFTLGSGGSFTFDMENASGSAGTGYDTLTSTGVVSVTATSLNPFVINLTSINQGTGLPGTATINLSQGYTWTLVTGSSISGFNAADFTIDSSSFANGLGIGNLYVTGTATGIYLNFTPVPEPSTWALMGIGAAALGLAACLRRRRSLSRA